MSCSVLKCVAVCFSFLQCAAPRETLLRLEHKAWIFFRTRRYLRSWQGNRSRVPDCKVLAIYPRITLLAWSSSDSVWLLREQVLSLQHTATHINLLQHTATHYNTLQHAASYSTRCNTLQHAATRCNRPCESAIVSGCLECKSSRYNTLQHTATHCNTLQLTATHCNTMQQTF